MSAAGSLSATDVARRIADRLVEDHLPYGIGGALALGAWGAPRATVDVDVSIFVTERELPRAFEALERAGVMIDRAQATRDVARIAMFKARAGRIFVDVFVSEHPQYADMRRRCAEIDGLSFISPEDLAIHKLLYGRAKDVVDLENLLALGRPFDFAYVRRWLVQMVPAGDRRFAALADLEQRFGG